LRDAETVNLHDALLLQPPIHVSLTKIGLFKMVNFERRDAGMDVAFEREIP
jgi:hypothetical protein